MRRRLPSRTALFLALAVLVVVAVPALGQPPIPTPPAGEEPELPQSGLVIDVDAEQARLYQIAVPNLIGASGTGGPAAAVVRNDLTLISLFHVLPERSYPAAELATLDFHPGPWSAIGAQGVVRGEVRPAGGRLEVEMRFYRLDRGGALAVTYTYRGSESELRGFMHDFGNRIVEAVTGERAHFDTQIAYARRIGPGHKEVYVADYDGHRERRISSGAGVSMLPGWGSHGTVFYSRLTSTGMFITRSGLSERALIEGNGLTMGPTVCGDRLFFTSTRDGNSEIYAARTDGRGVRRLTSDPGIDVSPSCGPGGTVAFVSTRHGSPQLFTMNLDGTNPQRVTFRGSHNQTPAFCPHPDRPLIAFTGRQDGLDIFVVDLRSQEYVRLTQGQGENKDPTFSPDCRMIAFTSTRRGGGVYVSSPRGFNQTRVLEGDAETIRWSRP